MSATFKDMLSEVKKHIREVSVQDVNARMNGNRDFTLLDVREKDEWDEGHLDGAVFLPRGFLEVKVEKMIPEKEKPVVVYCAGDPSPPAPTRRTLL